MAEVLPQEPAQAGFFVFADLDGRVAVYDRRSSRTHLIDPLSAEVLCALAEEPALGSADAVTLRTRLLIDGAGDASAIDEAAVAMALEQLREAGLVS